MQVKSIAECSWHSAILSTFIKLPFVFKTFVLSILERPLKTGFTIPEEDMCASSEDSNELSSRLYFFFNVCEQ